MYIRTPFFRNGKDKVLRVEVGAGVVDFYGERLIPNTIGQGAVITAFNASTEILRTGGDESPPVKINGIFVGGNHTSSAYYNLSAVAVDFQGNNIAILNSTSAVILNKLCLTETYLAGDAQIRNIWDFDVFGQVWFSQRIKAQQKLHLTYMFGAQAQRLVTKPGQRLFLIVPKSDLDDGIDVTDEVVERTLEQDDWEDCHVPPDHFIQEVREDGIPQFRFVTGYYSNVDRGNMSYALIRSTAQKVYPLGCQDVDMLPGMFQEVSGYFGSY